MLLYNSFYIAAPSAMQDKAREFVKLLAIEGLSCTSRWLWEPYVGTHYWGMHPPEHLVKMAQWDLEDVTKARTLVALNPVEFHNSGTGGRHIEMGVALALGKTIFLVGAITNIFHWHPNINVLKDDNLQDAARHIGRYVRMVENGRPTNR